MLSDEWNFGIFKPPTLVFLALGKSQPQQPQDQFDSHIFQYNGILEAEEQPKKMNRTLADEKL
jgi:hypothetical protein